MVVVAAAASRGVVMAVGGAGTNWLVGEDINAACWATITGGGIMGVRCSLLLWTVFRLISLTVSLAAGSCRVTGLDASSLCPVYYNADTCNVLFT